MSLHVIPVGDLTEHEESSDCICGPDLVTTEGRDIWAHNSLDGRERYERLAPPPVEDGDDMSEQSASIDIDADACRPCCSSHIEGPNQAIGMAACCDHNDCGPCCENCPTCPAVQRMRAAARDLG